MKKKTASIRYRCFGWNRGFALIFAIFLVVGLETVLAGGIFNLMRLQREVQHASDQMRLDWAAEAVVERAAKLLSDYASKSKEFPDDFGATSDDGTTVLGGDHSELVIGDSDNFSAYLHSWFETLKRSNLYSGALSDIAIAAEDIKIIQMPSDADSGNRERTYAIEITVKMMTEGVPTALQTTVRQEAVVRIHKIFDFSVFCNEDCEITAGPDFTLQGPIFSNQNIYLMIDKNNALNLEHADRFSDEFDPEPYIMRSAGNIYFYFKRAVGKNYFLSNTVYWDSVSSDYKFADSVKPAGPDSVKTPEIYPGLSSSVASYAPLPYFYYFKNGADCFTLPEQPLSSGDNCKTNRIFVENDQLFGDDISGVVRPRPRMYPQSMLNAGYYSGAASHDTANKFYTVSYNTGTTLSVSSAFDPTDMDTPAVNDHPNLSVYQGDEPLVREGFDTKKDVPIESRWIDPLTGDKNKDSVKLHSRADLEFLIGCQSDIASQKIKNHLATNDPRFFSSPDGKILKTVNASDTRANPIKYELNIGLMFERLELDPQVVYFHVCGTDERSSLRIVNGRKLPEAGLTVASSGRVWIKGDYNTFSYEKDDYVDPVKDWDVKDCFVGGKYIEFTGRPCVVPPAAIFSDSFGVLSKQWDDAWVPVNNGKVDPTREQRRVTDDVMINTALATGNTPSHLICNSKFGTAIAIDSTGSEVCVPKTDFENLPVVNMSRPGPDSGGQLLPFADVPNGVHKYKCPNRTYDQGINITDPACDYYREAVTNNRYHYYVNPKSEYIVTQSNSSEPVGTWSGYQIWMNKPGAVLPKCDPAVPGDCDRIRIPIFADPDPQYGLTNDLLWVTDVNKLRPEPPFPGVHFTTLNRYDLVGRTTRSCTSTYTYYCSVDSIRTAPNYSCDNIPAEGGDPSNCCADGSPPRPVTVCVGPIYSGIAPRLHYYFRDYEPLYVPVYSGGMENLINLQEDWGGRTLRFLGTLSIPWPAQKLTKDYGIYYYRAPERKFDFNEDLSRPGRSPAGTPSAVSVTRKQWSRSH